jgi:hypothetical protein
MAVLKHVAPASAFKVGVVAYGLVGLVLGTVCTVVSLAGFSLAAHGHMPFAGRVGMFAIILCPIVYGLIGGVSSAIGAVFYNLASNWVGGLEVEMG